jgi:hypothetical protein
VEVAFRTCVNRCVADALLFSFVYELSLPAVSLGTFATFPNFTASFYLHLNSGLAVDQD